MMEEVGEILREVDQFLVWSVRRHVQLYTDTE